jgi:hypothetical protein
MLLACLRGQLAVSSSVHSNSVAFRPYREISRSRRRKVGAYHVFIQAGVVAQGLLQYLAVVAPKLVWGSFGFGCEPFVPASHPPSLSLPWRCAKHFRFSFGFLQSLRSREIHRRSARHSKYEDIPHDGLTRTRHSRGIDVLGRGVRIQVVSRWRGKSSRGERPCQCRYRQVSQHTRTCRVF